MAVKKVTKVEKAIAAAPTLSEEYVADSSDDENPKSVKRPLTISTFRSPKSKSKVAQSITDEETSSSSEEVKEYADSESGSSSNNQEKEEGEGEAQELNEEVEKKGSDSEGSNSEESGAEDEQGSEAESDTSTTNEASKKRVPDSPNKQVERPSKKAKAGPHVPIAISAKPFSPPKGFEELALSTTKSRSPAFLSHSDDNQLWYFTAPSSISIESLGNLDMEAVLQGQPVIREGHSAYVLNPGKLKNETLLLVEGQDGRYVTQTRKISKIFNLQHSSLAKTSATMLTPSSPAKLNFTATTPGDEKPVRTQPLGLQMRYQPFGSVHHKSPSQTLSGSTEVFPLSDETMPDSANNPKKSKRKEGGRAEAEISKKREEPERDTPNSSSQVSSPAFVNRETREKKKKRKRKSGLVDDPNA